MNKILLGLFLFTSTVCVGQKNKTVVTDDILNFWKAYDKIISTDDSLKKIEIIQTQYIDKGTDGLKGIMQVKRYNPARYINAIKSYPMFWNSVRSNTLKAGLYAENIEKGIEKLRKIYPTLKPAKVFFTIGALWTGGTTLEDKVLIGSEVAMADSKVITSEFGKNLSHLPVYFASNKLKNITFLNVHEYIHTQQKTTIGNTLLAQTVLEGVCEFIATIALKVNSPNPQIAFGKQNDKIIKDAFVKEMFSTNFGNWIWNSPDNEFKMRDLAYYVGYALCEKYYTDAKDKKLAIKQMIELDYNNEESLIAFVESSKYFENNLYIYKEIFENSRPIVTKIEPFFKGQKDVDTTTKSVTIYFSEPMSKNSADFDIGPLGNDHTMWIKKRIGFSENGLSYTIELQPLVANKSYQLLITDAFVNKNGIPLKPYLIEMTTKQ